MEEWAIDKLRKINFDNVKWSPFHIIIIRLVNCLYETDDCSCGGLGHVVIDDNNIDTDSINNCIKLCDENPDKAECELVKCIMTYLLKLNEDQRAHLFFVWDILGSPGVEYDFEYEENFNFGLDYYRMKQNEFGGYKND